MNSKNIISGKYECFSDNDIIEMIQNAIIKAMPINSTNDILKFVDRQKQIQLF